MEDRQLIAEFRPQKNAFSGVEFGTVFPSAAALAATFDVGLIRSVGFALSDEVRAGGEGDTASLSVEIPSFEGGVGKDFFGTERLLAYNSAAAFAKGIEKRIGGKMSAAAFPRWFGDTALLSTWLRQKRSLGVSLMCDAKGMVADFARFSGVIYQKVARPLVVEENGRDDRDLRAAAYLKAGAVCGGVYRGARIDGRTAERLAAKIRGLEGRLNLSETTPVTSLRSKKALALAAKAARDGMILMKNDGVLPLDGVKTAAVIGSAHSLGRAEEVAAALVRRGTVFQCYPLSAFPPEDEREVLSLVRSANLTVLIVDLEGEMDACGRQFYAKVAENAQKSVEILCGAADNLSSFMRSSAVLLALGQGEFAAEAVAESLVSLPSGALPYPVVTSRGIYPVGFGLGFPSADVYAASKICGRVEALIVNRKFAEVRCPFTVWSVENGRPVLRAYEKITLAPLEKRLCRVAVNCPDDAQLCAGVGSRIKPLYTALESL